MADEWDAFRAAKAAGADDATLTKLYRQIESRLDTSRRGSLGQKGSVKPTVSDPGWAWNPRLRGAWREAHPDNDDQDHESEQEAKHQRLLCGERRF